MGNKVVAFIRSNEWFKSTMVEHGTHNGYIDVHGGITFSEPAISGEESIGSKRKINPRYVGKRNPILDNAEFITDNTEIGNDWWIFGFDTFHYGDDKYNWDKQAVIQETMNLMEQIEK